MLQELENLTYLCDHRQTQQELDSASNGSDKDSAFPEHVGELVHESTQACFKHSKLENKQKSRR